MSTRPQLQRIYRKSDLPAFTGLQRTAIEKLIEEGKFPKPFKLNDYGNAVAWTESALIEWQEKWLATRSSNDPNGRIVRNSRAARAARDAA